jgi:hypothetical protein
MYMEEAQLSAVLGSHHRMTIDNLDLPYYSTLEVELMNRCALLQRRRSSPSEGRYIDVDLKSFEEKDPAANHLEAARTHS